MTWRTFAKSLATFAFRNFLTQRSAKVFAKVRRAEDVLKRSSTEPHTKIKRLRIYTGKPEQFEVKKKYLFTVKVKGAVPPGRQSPMSSWLVSNQRKNNSPRFFYFGTLPVFNIDDGQSFSTRHSSHKGRRALQMRRP